MIKFKRVDLPGQFSGSYSRSPELAITDNTTVEDTLSVPDSGLLKTVSVSVVIYHTYINDLKVSLLSPDSTEAVLHDHTGGSADNIIQTFTSDTSSMTLSNIFKNKSINGTWTLRIQDTANGDAGSLDSWTLDLTYN